MALALVLRTEGDTRLRVLFIGLILLSGFSLGSVDGSRAGDCHALYSGSPFPSLVTAHCSQILFYIMFFVNGRYYWAS